MQTKVLIFVVLLLSGLFPAFAIEQKLPTAYAESSDYSISYADWDMVLSSVVLETGLSDRRPAGRSGTTITSSRIRHGNTSVTAFEGNRVLFYKFNDEHVEQLLAIRRDLEAVTSFMPLERFSKNEQLAYWLNLHNIAVMIELAKEYPVKKIRNLVTQDDGVWSAKTMSINGVAISIRDIERHVVANWNDPLVIYGFFMGAVGGPNIRATAFTGENVIKSLRNNAVEFVNSLRGYRVWSGQGRVSEHYKLGSQYFENFDRDIKAHLLKYALQNTRRIIEGVEKFRPDSYDWTIADLKGGDTFNGGSFNTSSASLAFFLDGPGAGNALTAFNTGAFDKGRGTVPMQIRTFVQAVQERYRRRALNGEVTVEEYIDSDCARVTRKGKDDEVPVTPEEEDEEKPVI